MTPPPRRVDWCGKKRRAGLEVVFLPRAPFLRPRIAASAAGPSRPWTRQRLYPRRTPQFGRRGNMGEYVGVHPPHDHKMAFRSFRGVSLGFRGDCAVFRMVGQGRLELPTYGLGICRQGRSSFRQASRNRAGSRRRRHLCASRGVAAASRPYPRCTPSEARNGAFGAAQNMIDYHAA